MVKWSRILSVVTILAMLWPASAGISAPSEKGPKATKTLIATVDLAPGQAKKVLHDEARMEIGTNAVSEPATISIQPLQERELPELDQGMVNVTKGPRAGYRFLPHRKFNEKFSISLPYDRKLIPPGYSDADIRTFYFDEEAGSWQELEHATTDAEAQLVTSLTDHFTDMINAVVTVPDSPSTQSANPNDMADIDPASPAEGISLIQPPQPDNTGEANLAYPLELPPGRHGIAPQLSLQYSSGASNGWLGLGWMLSMPAISVETRWGVPRYSATTETETYLLDGQQLAPVAHRGAQEARTADKQFHPRVEGEFAQVIRHGNHPSTYWWEVTDKDGTRFLYGDEPGGPLGTHTIRDQAGNIFQWALREVRDLNENTISYTYEQVTHTGVAGGTVPGVQLYPKSINYTGSGSQPGPYTVTFLGNRNLTGAQRPDVLIDARGGFKMVTADLLRQIQISLNGELIRQYDLDYQEGAFGKSLLTAITQRGEDGSLFHTHTFTYYEEPLGFASPVEWTTHNDNVAGPVIEIGESSAISGSVTTGGGGHIYVGFNFSNPTKANSAGGKVGFNYSDNEGVLELIDLNGDTLPDKVFKDGSGLWFRPAQRSASGSITYGAKKALPTLPGISREHSVMVSGGGEAYPGPLSVFLNHAESFVIGSTYFADANGDGLLDLVSGGQVLFNHLAADGTPTFSADSSATPVPVGPGAVDTAGLIEDYEQIYQDQIDASPLLDTLRRWIAPFDGTIRIDGTVALVQDTSTARSRYETADGVRVAVQQNGGELWSAEIEATDYSPKSPSGLEAIPVRAGDRLYFRVQSRFDGSYDQVAWDPEITYLGTDPTTDVNGLDLYRYKASEDFVLAGRPGSVVTMPFTGTIKVTGLLQKPATTDDVTLLVTQNGSPVVNTTLSWNETAAITLDETIEVAAGDALQFRVQVDSPINLSGLQWSPSLHYTAVTDLDRSGQPILVKDANGNDLIHLSPPFDIAMYPVNTLTAPQQPWTVPETGTVTVDPDLFGMPDATGTITFTVKRRGALLAKQSLPVVAGMTPGGSFSLAVTAGEELYFDFSSADPELTQKLFSTGVTVAYPDDESTVTVPSTLHSAAEQGLFGQPYRGWGYAGYNGNRERAALPIAESLLVLNASDFQEDCDPSQLTTPEAVGQSNCQPEKSMAYPYSPLPEEDTWRGPNQHSWAAEGSMSSSRLGIPYISVPRPGQFAGGRAVMRFSRATQTSAGGGAGPVGGSYSGDPLPGESYTVVDFLDLNGDQFPDIIGDGRVQYTTPDGGLEGANRSVTGLGSRIRDSVEMAYNVGIGGNPAHFKVDSGGSSGSGGNSSPKSGKQDSQMVTLGFGGDLGGGHSRTESELLDVNGDGLPDRVTRDGSALKVALNLGYSFAPAESWGSAAVADGAAWNFSLSGSAGFNGGTYDFAGGISLSRTESKAGCTDLLPITGDCSDGQLLLDLNGDGLPDKVTPTGSAFRVNFNTGAGFGPATTWSGAMSDAAGISTDTNLGGGTYFTIGIGPLCKIGCYIIINPGFDISQSMARQELAVMDVDGDGHPDQIASDDDGSLTVARSQLGKTHLLKTVSRPLGATITLDYEQKGNTYADPYPRWVLSRVATHDGHPGDGDDTHLTTYQYEGGVFDRLEREFYGFSRVTEQQRVPYASEPVYRSVIREYFNNSFYAKGLLTKERLVDADGNPYLESLHTYQFRDVTTGTEGADQQSTTAVIFPYLVRTDQRYYEGQATAGKSTYVTYAYDSLGRMTAMSQAGDAGARDDLHVTLSYLACPATYRYSDPTTVIMADGQGTELRRREATIDCTTGNLQQVREYLDETAAAVTDFTYFPNGNLQQVTKPANATGQRYQLTYEYDPVVSIYVTAVTDSFGYRSTSTYNLKYGDVDTTTDINGNQTSYAYDSYGRLVSVTGPYQQGTGTPTIQIAYHHADLVPWALTRRIDTFRDPADPIDTVIFSDGLGRSVQSKQDATIHTSSDSLPQDVMVVSGTVVYDFVGRAIAEYYPSTEPLGTPGTFNGSRDTVAPTRSEYDPLDRMVAITAPNNAVTRFAYGFAPDRSGAIQFETTVTDANGMVKQRYHDTGRRVTSLREFNQGGAEEIWTSYAYNALGEIIQVLDDQENLTQVGYDRLGRRTSIISPDTGRTDYQFDLASNLIARITPTLAPEGKAITYVYDYHRLTAIHYPNYPDTDVYYTYGEPGAADNRAGRIVRVEDQSGSEERFYGKLGEITRTVKTIASETQGNSANSPEVYTTEFVYDTFARLQSLTYPDGEVLTYRYDSGGLLQSASGIKAGNTYRYVNRLEYDKFGMPAFQETGNQIKTRYEYDPETLFLTRLKAGKGEGNLFQNLAYSHDLVGNILSVANEVAVPPASQFGGPSLHQFTYDDLYRLTGATGSYQYNPDKGRRYSLNLTYDSIHNILSKEQTDETVQPSGTVIPERETSYNWQYSYDGSQPHTATHIGDRTYTYDASGNMTGWTDDQNGTRRVQVWDDEDRIRSIFNNGQELTYKYNDQGERVMKQGPQGETVYVNSYFTIRNRERGTKQIWAGGRRIASKLVKHPKPGQLAEGDVPLEKDLYFYHADFQGSSGYVTDARGKLFMHTEYFPFGETWVQEKSNTQRTPYLFAGKELDEETGLYYFGARYYDPQTSLWQSADPILGSYLNGKGSGGVFNSLNLQLYGYARLNPATLTDPDGRETKRVRYFKSKYAEEAREYRSQYDVGGRNLATLAFKRPGKQKVETKTMESDGFHSEARLWDWFSTNCKGCKVQWLYTELAPCGSDVHNCSQRVQNWWGDINVYYSLDYPNSDDVNEKPSGGGKKRTHDERNKIAKKRRRRSIYMLKGIERELTQRVQDGTPLTDDYTPPSRATQEIDSSDDEGGFKF